MCFRFSSFPLKWFPASKRSLWDQAFPCLGNGQHDPHVAPGFLLLPCCGWCWWAPLQVAWPLSATVVSPDQEFGTLEPLKLRNQVFLSATLFLSSLFLEVFDYFWPCPLLSKQPDFSYFKTPKGKPFINLYKIESISIKIVILSAAVSVFLLLHGGQVVSQFGTEKFVTKGLLHFFMVLMFFFLLLTGSTGLDLSHLGGWADRRRCPPRPRARTGLAGLGPK